jgi:hypothetical protein
LGRPVIRSSTKGFYFWAVSFIRFYHLKQILRDAAAGGGRRAAGSGRRNDDAIVLLQII